MTAAAVVSLLWSSSAALTIPAAKSALRTALSDNGGDSKAAAVVAAVDDLAALCPFEAPAREPSILGEWRQINAPEYAGGTQAADGAFQYTLGRLSFGIFEPKDLMCTLGPILNPLRGGADAGVIEYEIQIPFSIERDAGSSLSAELLNFATCTAESDTRLAVAFSGGVMKPAGDCDRSAWRELFGPALAAKPGKRARVMNWLLKRMMGLIKPSQLEGNDEMSYQMTKAPKGYLEVLYLDEELRITRGNRGSLVVCERV